MPDDAPTPIESASASTSAAGPEVDAPALAVGVSMPAHAARPSGPLGRLTGGIGQSVRARLGVVNALFEMVLRVLKAVWQERGRGRLVVPGVVHKQILFTGVHAFWLIFQVAVLMGIVLGLGVTVLANAEISGAVQDGLSQNFTATVQLLLIEFGTTTISPLFITLIIIARSATAIASELALMRIRGETSALEAMGISLDYFVIWPRILGMVISMICLTIFFNFVMIAVHFAMVNAFAISETVRSVAQIERASRLINLVQAMLKTGVIGAGVAVISCYFGLLVQRSFTEVPQAATRAVVTAIVFSVMANVAIFVLFYFLFGFAVTSR